MKWYLFKNVCVGGGGYILICVECFVLKFIVNFVFFCECRFNDVFCVFSLVCFKLFSFWLFKKMLNVL